MPCATNRDRLHADRKLAAPVVTEEVQKLEGLEIGRAGWGWGPFTEEAAPWARASWTGEIDAPKAITRQMQKENCF